MGFEAWPQPCGREAVHIRFITTTMITLYDSMSNHIVHIDDFGMSATYNDSQATVYNSWNLYILVYFNA